MARVLIPLKFKQIALDNFPNIPDDAPIVQIIAIAGSKTDVSTAVVRAGLDWLKNHGDELELKDGVTAGKGLKRLCSCLENAIEQAQKPKTAPPKPTKNHKLK
jgi:hypothetical protein